MVATPTGTITFLFTDIEGSTALWENYPLQMEADLACHDQILRETVEAHDGYVFKGVGDACYAAFAHPREALRAALAAQRTLFAERWSDPINLRVRMALHTGTPEERDGDYFGPPLNRVSRLLAAAHGGQILLSGTTYNLVRDHPELVEEEARLVDLGEHRLKDLTHPEQIYQLAVRDLPERFPPLRADRTPDDFDSRYRFKDFLGSGGMAKVYLAHDEELDRDVAIKVLHPRYVGDAEFVERFRREARSAAKLSHPNIVPIYDRGEKKDGTYYMVMEHLPGGTLKDIIVRKAPLAPHIAVNLALQIAQALEEAHRKGIIHRDIKPQNILLTESGEAKVADFGIAKAASASTLTPTGLFAGTAHYISPEQTLGQAVSPKSDLYALGVVLYEMLTGEIPYDADTPVAIAMKQLHEPLRSPMEINPNVPERVTAVTERLLAKDPHERHPDTTALVKDLERILRSLGEEDDASHFTVTDRMVARPSVQVPDLTGKSVFVASSELADIGLTLGDQNEVSSDAVPEGGIIDQSPEAGTEVEPDSLVSVTVSSGSSIVEVPDLTGQSRSEASATLAAIGLRLGGRNNAPGGTISEGGIIEQYPAAGTKVNLGSSVSVTLGPSSEESATIAPVGSEPEEEPAITVPDVSGRSIREAGRTLEGVGLVLANSREQKRSFKSAGTVMSTAPSAGSRVALGTPVAPIVSGGLAVAPWVLLAALIAAVLVGIGSVVAFVGGGGPLGGTPTATIVSDLALQGASRPQNETINNAITLALEERDYMAGDVQIEYEVQDNATAQAGKWDEAKCAENAQSAVPDEEIVGWIGPGNSGCAAIEIPILNQANLAMVSPGVTALGLTKPSGEPGEPEKYYPTDNRNFTRVVLSDEKQGRAGAVWMRDLLGVDSVYILDDGETYGVGVADQFQRSALEMGIDILGRESIDGDAANYRSLMESIAQENPDAIYFGGIAENNAGQLVKDKLRAGMSNEDVVFMGPDGLRKDAFLEAAGDEAENTYLTFGGLPTNLLPEQGQDFVERYEERFGPVETYTVHGYEAANVLLDAIGRAYDNDGEVTREGVVRELFATEDYDGALGTWSFDEDGDTTLSQLSGQRVEDGEFTFDLDRAINVGV
jgi:serine/threonine protein kinase/class 3 adenylate cyclase/ABC-type branched-subunit amino acid transport system substrate-binding protein